MTTWRREQQTPSSTTSTIPSSGRIRLTSDAAGHGLTEKGRLTRVYNRKEGCANSLPFLSLGKRSQPANAADRCIGLPGPIRADANRQHATFAYLVRIPSSGGGAASGGRGYDGGVACALGVPLGDGAGVGSAA